MYYRYRQYDPRAGRFTARDPLKFCEAAVACYPYSASRPTSITDPMGLLDGVTVTITHPDSPGWSVDVHIGQGGVSATATVPAGQATVSVDNQGDVSMQGSVISGGGGIVVSPGTTVTWAVGPESGRIAVNGPVLIKPPGYRPSVRVWSLVLTYADRECSEPTECRCCHFTARARVQVLLVIVVRRVGIPGIPGT